MSRQKTAAHRQDELQGKINSLREQFISLLTTLSETIDARDPHTRRHSIKVCQHALAIGAQLGLSHQNLERLEIAALLHDIGKMGVEAFILQKPAVLDEVEMMAIRHHPLLGVRILEPVRQLADVIPFIRHHHERYDGGGYPDGLRGEKIPLEARILAVADSYDAMTSHRPYRKALSSREAIGELREEAGTQFDPRVVEAFCAVLESGNTPAGSREKLRE
jgi:putative nucleotidyltransferase with HDIG domain